MDFPGRTAGRIRIYAAVLPHSSAERRLCGDQLRISHVAMWPGGDRSRRCGCPWTLPDPFRPFGNVGFQAAVRTVSQ